MLWRYGLLSLFLPLLGCSPSALRVEQDSPEETAQSVGRVLCAEHRARVEAISASFSDALAIQRAKAALAASPSSLEQGLEKLEQMADFFDEHEDELKSCRVVLTDLDVVDADTKVHLSLELERYDWSADAGSELKLHKSTLPMLLTLTR
ncbi:MAG: hypothetical protein RBU37_15730, partial [Myxococcota bacterium]|nr:hypothetical protein [Myxococcota bacterium]